MSVDATATVPSSDAAEAGEVMAFCPRCGQPKGDFDIFCGRCGVPLARKFAYLFCAEILLILATGIVIGLAHCGKLPSIFLKAGMPFILQLVSLYFARLALRERRFLLLLAIYLAFCIVGISGAGMESAFLRCASIYLAAGTAFLWGWRLRQTGKWEGIQTLWLGLLVVGWSLGAFTAVNPALDAHSHESMWLNKTRHFLSNNVPWLSIAGFIVTLAVESALRVSKQGIPVKKDYFQNARIKPVPLTQDIKASFAMVPLILCARLLKRFVAFSYNAMIGALNVIVRGIVFIWRLVQASFVTMLRLAAHSVKGLATFALSTARRVAIPFLAMYFVADITTRSATFLPQHLFEPTWGTALGILWKALALASITYICIACFADAPLARFSETYFRDCAVVVGYGIPLLVLLTAALRLASMATARYLQFDLGYRFGPLTWISVGIMLAGGVFLLKQRLSSLVKPEADASADPGAAQTPANDRA